VKPAELLPSLLQAVGLAALCCERIARELAHDDQQAKADFSPVTIADYASQALILQHLAHLSPDIGVVAEEASDILRDQPDMIERIASFTQVFDPEVNARNLLTLLDRGNHPGGGGRFWTLDPIDGTKGYLRGGQYAIALALVEDGRPRLGVLGCPRYGTPGGSFFSGGLDLPALRWDSDAKHASPIRVCADLPRAETKLCESIESSHTAHDRSATVISALGMSCDVLRMDSQAKYAAVACGDAALYLRLPVKRGYREKIWDHAAGVAVIEAAGGRVTDLNGKTLDFGRGDSLECNRGVLASNGTLHAEALAAALAHTPLEGRWE
jgi:3'-phosphoadenosine 5'-phosphosulfate (PAPS) 3'-phosphatase